MNSVSPGTGAKRPSAQSRFGSFDPLRAARHEIPPKMTFPVEGSAAEQHKACVGFRVQYCHRSRREYDHPRCRDTPVVAADTAAHHERGALGGLYGQGEIRALGQPRLDVDQRRERLDRRNDAVRAPHEDPQMHTVDIDRRQCGGGMVPKVRRGLLVRLRQRDPELPKPCRGEPASRSDAPVRSECAMPRPAVIQLIAPGSIGCT